MAAARTVPSVTDDRSAEPAREQLLSIASREVDGAVVLAVAGEIDLHTAPRLLAAVDTGFDQASDGPLVIDLTDVSFLGSAGLAALVSARRQAQRRREPLRIVVDHNRPVIRPLEITGLDEVLALYHTVDEALVG